VSKQNFVLTAYRNLFSVTVKKLNTKFQILLPWLELAAINIHSDTDFRTYELNTKMKTGCLITAITEILHNLMNIHSEP